MILPETLVQYTGDNSRLRKNGIYTVRSWDMGTGYHQSEWSDEPEPCDAGVIWVREAVGPTYGGAFCSCRFRIIAPPISEADRLEASAPVSDGPIKKQPVKVV